ncbi:MAG: STAS domain-containing protein [Ruminococcus sp.]|nr:STAS domain-containing protein [Ruminococcus sp.]
MNITSTVENNTCTLSIEGRIDTLTAPQLEQVFNENADKCDTMIFDLEKTEYITSAGLRVILVAHREMEKKQGLVLKNLNRNVANIIKIIGFDKKIRIE